MKNGERQNKLASLGLMTLGLANMVLHPRKTYKLLVHKVGWYD